MFELNDLSILIYVADVVPRAISVLATILVALATIGSLLAWPIASDSDCEKIRPYWFLGLKILIPLAFVAFTVGLFVPSKETFYLMASSEIGETVSQSDYGEKILNDLREVIDAQLEKLKE